LVTSRSCPRAEGIEQHHLQIAAMDRELRMFIARRTPQRLLIDQLAEAIEEGRVRGRNRDLRQISLESKRGEFPGGMGKQVDADADRFDLGGRLEDPAGDSGRVQRKPERQSANAGADDDDVVHVLSRHLLSSDCGDETRLVSPLSI
jgi:hypothetical protein